MDKAASSANDNVLAILEDMTGRSAPFRKDLDQHVGKLLGDAGIGYSQFNELLLLLGLDRVTPSFFQFIIDSRTQYVGGNALKSMQELREGVDRFRKLAILSFGNVKFGFKYLSDPKRDLSTELAGTGPIDPSEFISRHPPLLPLEAIPADRTYYLGYMIEGELNERLKTNPNDADAKQQLEERAMIVQQGRRNHEAYLASDHMDVYVATSMRERHEFQIIGQVVREVFQSPDLHKLKVRWFDPTQAYCKERIDKGLAEALMLKRAACTLYLAQESDTLGKDSELACTLAQGKPVVAYIPRVTEQDQDVFVSKLLAMVAEGAPNLNERERVLGQLKVFSPKVAWEGGLVSGWISNPGTMDLTVACKMLGNAIRLHYEKRASDIKEKHPLGIQVHLQTGVANGVLVARTTSECAALIYRILTGTLEFRIEEVMIEEGRYLLLREMQTNSIFRVATGDRFLTNAFWNFYLAK